MKSKLIHLKWDRLLHLLLEYVHRSLVCFQLLILEENPPLQLQRRRQVRVIAEVAFKEEACHQTFPKHRLRQRNVQLPFILHINAGKLGRGKKEECFHQNKTTLQINKTAVTSADQRNGAI